MDRHSLNLPFSLSFMRRSFFLLILLLLALPLTAQNSKKVKDLQKQRDQLQKEVKRSQQQLEKTRQNITQHKRVKQQIGVKLDQHLDSIRHAEDRMVELDSQMVVMQDQLYDLSVQLQGKKDHYASALRAARASSNVKNRSLHVLSAKKFSQMYRRIRETNFMADILRSLGEDLQAKEAEHLVLQNNLLTARGEMNALMISVMEQRRNLGMQQRDEEAKISKLGTEQKGLESQISRQRNQLAQLNKKIDAVVAAEVEAARKKAEEARKKAAAEAAKKKGTTSSKTTTGKSTSSKTTTTSAPADKWLTPEEKALNGSFVQNKGRLPVPITGSYKLGERFGTYNVPGMKNVQLDNKGVNYIGKPGAHARSVFDGEVTAVFQFYNTKGVLVRHGSYITVYCNLSSVQVQRGQKVKARDNIGAVAANSDGVCVLHFQLRKETAKLNPEQWIGR